MTHILNLESTLSILRSGHGERAVLKWPRTQYPQIAQRETKQRRGGQRKVALLKVGKSCCAMAALRCACQKFPRTTFVSEARQFALFDTALPPSNLPTRVHLLCYTTFDHVFSDVTTEGSRSAQIRLCEESLQSKTHMAARLYKTLAEASIPPRTPLP